MSHTLSFYYYISRHWSLESYLLFTDRYTDDDSGTGSDIEASFTTRYSF
ncbi:MAG TPA: hypothetical protein VKS21_09155 [Spirochaetota bacterium]|nr:hypothetical protein [Spirochaetota bacterium]